MEDGVDSSEGSWETQLECMGGDLLYNGEGTKFVVVQLLCGPKSSNIL